MSEDIEFRSNTSSVETIAKLILNVMTSAADAEICALFVNTRQSVLVRYLLKEMGHLQPPTPIKTENMTALGFVTNILQPNATKSTDMNFWFMRDRQDQNQCRYYRRSGATNDVNYHTKHYSPAHHQDKICTFLTPCDVLDTL